MTGVYIMLGGMVLFSLVMVFIDWMGKRQDQPRRRP